MSAGQRITALPILLTLFCLPFAAWAAEVNDGFRWERMCDLPASAAFTDAFFGVHNGVLILAGGMLPATTPGALPTSDRI